MCSSVSSCFTEDLPSGTYLSGDQVFFDLDSVLEGENVQCVVNSTKMVEASVQVMNGASQLSTFDRVLAEEYIMVHSAATGDFGFAYTQSTVTLLKDQPNGPQVQKTRDFSPLNIVKMQVASDIYILLQDSNTGEIKLQVLDRESLGTKREVDTSSAVELDPLVSKFAVGDKKTSSKSNLILYSTGEAKLAIFQDNEQQIILRGYFTLKKGNIEGFNQDWSLLKLIPIYQTGDDITVQILVSNPSSAEKLIVRCSLKDLSMKLVCDPQTHSLGELSGQLYFSPGDWPSRYALADSRLLPDIISLYENTLSVFSIDDFSVGYRKIEEFAVSGIDDVYGLYSPAESQYILYVELSKPASENEKFGLIRIRLRDESTDVIKTPNQDKYSLVVPRILANGSVQVTLFSKTRAVGYLLQKNQISINTGATGLGSSATLSVECSCLTGKSSKTINLDLLKNAAERHRLRLPYTVSGPCGSKYVAVPVDAKSTNANSPEIKFFNTTVPGVVSPSDPLHSNQVGSLHIYDGRDSKARKNVSFASLTSALEISENRVIVFNEEGRTKYNSNIE